ncbi:Histidine phosphatase superfamily, clade-1 [Melia azedarach]|uniref:Histidine phosphatase superfamily, clade-1 n=1 Tax=Melia azedarach TaxID=155640 RepID=A0ACC1YUM6_MELAZ|nr:Histidine phosphatase superfamily, clade-1 [Melia azedarach]
MDKSNDSPVTVTVDSNCGERNCNAVAAKKWFRRSGEGSDRQKPVSCEGVSRQFQGERDRKLRMISSGRPSSGGEEYHRAQQTATRPARSSLNPSANEWSPCSERAPEEDRCLFLTFSNGYPLAESQIVSFFTK